MGAAVGRLLVGAGAGALLVLGAARADRSEDQALAPVAKEPHHNDEELGSSMIEAAAGGLQERRILLLLKSLGEAIPFFIPELGKRDDWMGKMEELWKAMGACRLFQAGEYKTYMKEHTAWHDKTMKELVELNDLKPVDSTMQWPNEIKQKRVSLEMAVLLGLVHAMSELKLSKVNREMFTTLRQDIRKFLILNNKPDFRTLFMHFPPAETKSHRLSEIPSWIGADSWIEQWVTYFKKE